MSHARGHVDFKDGDRFYYEYNGTADIVLPKLWETTEELHDNWRKGNPFDKKCECDKSETACAFSSYGSGWWFPVKACKECMVITNSPDPFENMID